MAFDRKQRCGQRCLGPCVQSLDFIGRVQRTRSHLAGSRGTLVGGCKGGNAPLARRRPGRREMSEGVSVQTRTTCRMPPHQPAGIAKRAVWCGGVLNAGTTKGIFVVSHGSSQECLRRQGGETPLTPACRGTLGLSYGSRAGEDAVRAITCADGGARLTPVD